MTRIIRSRHPVISGFRSLADKEEISVRCQNSYSDYTKVYYHFVMCFLLPILDFLTSGHIETTTRLGIRYPGMFKGIIDELNTRGVINVVIENALRPAFVALESFDPYVSISPIAFRPCAVSPETLERISEYMSSFYHPIYSDLLIINRNAKNPHRSIDLSGVVSPTDAELDMKFEELEECSFAKQFGSFAGARVIVAEHGSGLANLVWCDLNRIEKVVEICPNEQSYTPYFQILCDLLGIKHVSVSPGEDMVKDIRSELE